jgi:hypothetical protein
VFGEEVLVLICQPASQLLERFVDGVAVHPELQHSRLKVQRQRRAVAHRVRERVQAHIALLVLLGAKRPERVVVAPVDGRAGESEQEGVRERFAHLDAEVALLGAMGLVDEDDDVLAVVELARGLAELVDCRDDDLAHIVVEQLLKLLAAVGGLEVRDVVGVEGR